ncbi:MAG: histidine phosphatase family protein [Thermoleophilaceae bacterium]
MPPEIVLVRHGETEWSRDRRHTGRTDIPLTDAGRGEARALRPRLAERDFARVLVSPLGRAVETCRLAGLGERAEERPELVEFDYGDAEGVTTAELRQTVPGWTVWTHGAETRGESPADVGARLEPVLAELSGADRDAAVVAHGHVLRVLAAMWIGMPPDGGARLALSTGTLSTLGWERETQVIRSWNA